jgi:GNAT superfamily N-acetyltransferase
MTILIRRAQPADLNAIMHIQAQAYSADLIEEDTIMLARLQMPNGISCVLEQAGTVQAYLLMYLSHLGYISTFNSPFNSPSEPAIKSCLYLHDLACATDSQGMGFGQQLIHHAMQYARGAHCHSLALVAVQDAFPFWQKLGFQVSDNLSPYARQQLHSYGPAHYCIKNLVD